VTAVDLGMGTTESYIGGPILATCSVWSVDGRRVAIPVTQLLALSLALQHGTTEAAFRIGIAETTLKDRLTRLYRKLGAFNKWEAATALGWVRIPPELLDASPEANADGGRSVAGPRAGAARQLAPARHEPRDRA
jgi:hypothetical protein